MPTIKMRDAQSNWVDVYSGGGDTLLDIIDAKIAAHCPYEPGDYCISDNGTSPAERWPGTVWAQLPPGTFLAAAGEGYAVGSTGGAAEVALTVEQLAVHGHKYTSNPNINFTSSGTGMVALGYGTVASTTSTVSAGSGAAHENRPPYYATNIWRRTA